MDALWLCASNCQFALSSSAFIVAPGDKPQESPEETLRLLIAYNGACQIAIEGGNERLEGDRMLLINGRAKYKVEEPSEELLLMRVDISHMPAAREDYSLRQLYYFYRDYQGFCQSDKKYFAFHDRHLLVRFTAESLSQYTAYEPARRYPHMTMILTYMILVITSALYEKQQQSFQYNRHVRKAVEYIHDNYMRSISAEEIASYVGIHPGHLHRLFRTEIGTRVTEYLTNLRLEKAKTLLRRTDTPITIITSMVGICSQQYLSRLFQKNVGMTPQAYRKSYNVTCDYDEALKYYAITFDASAAETELSV